jgi:hypothetical protein
MPLVQFESKMTMIANAGADPWPAHPVTAPIEIGEVQGTTRNVGVSGVVFDSPASFAVGSAISFVISMRSGTEAPVRLECSGIVTENRATAGGTHQTAATIQTIRITGST